MSLADLVPLILATRKERPALTPEERKRLKHERWRKKNREHLRAYRRAWEAKRRAKA